MRYSRTPPPRNVRRSSAYITFASRPPPPPPDLGCPVNLPPGVDGAWLLLQGSRRVSWEAGRAWGRKRGARWLLLGRALEKTRASGRARTHLHTPQSRRARAAAAPARTVADSCCNSVCSGPEEGQRSGAPGTLRKARAGVGACGHGVRVAPGPREGARPSSAAGSRPHACWPPLLCSSLLCRRGAS